MKASPIRMPGTIPAINSVPTEQPASVAYMTSGMLGGMMIPSPPEFAIRAEAKPGS